MPSGPSKRATIFTVLPFVAAVFGVSAGFAACADAQHLDPASTTTSSGTGGSVVHFDAGADAPPPAKCKSNPDCGYPTPVCNTTTQTCTECLVISDCTGKPGTVCSFGACVCPSLDASASLQYCVGETPACVDVSSSPTNCGSCGNTCFGPCTMGKCGNAWSPLSTTNAPEPRSHHVAVWTGTQMFVWGGKDGGTALGTGGLYNPTTQTWTPTSTAGAPAARWDATAIWDDVDGLVVVWGGTTGGNMGGRQDGGRYDPVKDMWTPITTASAPTARVGHSAVWVSKVLQGFMPSTSGMIVWGGVGNGATSPFLGDGAIYDPSIDKWVGTVDSAGAPAARAYHAGVWDSGSRMIVFGGEGTMGSPAMNVALPDMNQYTPGSGWNVVGTTATTPSKRYQSTGIWDQTSMSTLVWGGYDGTAYLQDGAQFSGTATWTTIGSMGALPEGRTGHSSVIVTVGGKSRLLIFGGDQGGSTILDKGWSLDITASAWTPLPTPGPLARTHHTAVSNGATMYVFGGDTTSGPTNTGASFTSM